VTDANGCASASAPISVNVSNAPTPTISASSTQACSGDVVTVTSSAADSYLWSTGETSQSIQVTDNASVYVIVTNANACNGVGQSATTNITFTATPTAAGSFTTAGNVVTFTNTSTGASSYSWDFGDFTNSSATAPAHAYAANGAYTVILTAINGNCSSTVTFEISIEVGIDETTALNCAVFPNPATDQVVVAFENNSTGVLNILDATGRLVYTQQINEIGAVQVPVNVNELASGTYTIQLINATLVGTKRLVIRH
jgi:PKD repeat protein